MDKDDSAAPRERGPLIRWGATGALSMFGVAGLAPYIGPDGWAIWPALALLALAGVALLRLSRFTR